MYDNKIVPQSKHFKISDKIDELKLMEKQNKLKKILLEKKRKELMQMKNSQNHKNQEKTKRNTDFVNFSNSLKSKELDYFKLEEIEHKSKLTKLNQTKGVLGSLNEDLLISKDLSSVNNSSNKCFNNPYNNYIQKKVGNFNINPNRTRSLPKSLPSNEKKYYVNNNDPKIKHKALQTKLIKPNKYYNVNINMGKNQKIQNAEKQGEAKSKTIISANISKNKTKMSTNISNTSIDNSSVSLSYTQKKFNFHARSISQSNKCFDSSCLISSNDNKLKNEISNISAVGNYSFKEKTFNKLFSQSYYHNNNETKHTRQPSANKYEKQNSYLDMQQNKRKKIMISFFDAKNSTLKKSQINNNNSKGSTILNILKDKFRKEKEEALYKRSKSVATKEQEEDLKGLNEIINSNKHKNSKNNVPKSYRNNCLRTTIQKRNKSKEQIYDIIEKDSYNLKRTAVSQFLNKVDVPKLNFKFYDEKNKPQSAKIPAQTAKIQEKKKIKPSSSKINSSRNKVSPNLFPQKSSNHSCFSSKDSNNNDLFLNYDLNMDNPKVKAMAQSLTKLDEVIRRIYLRDVIVEFKNKLLIAEEKNKMISILQKFNKKLFLENLFVIMFQMSNIKLSLLCEDKADDKLQIKSFENDLREMKKITEETQKIKNKLIITLQKVSNYNN